MEFNIEKKTWFTNMQVLYMIAAAISFTFTITMIYSEFIYQKTQMDVLERRIEKKTGRNATDIKQLEKRIINLEKK